MANRAKEFLPDKEIIVLKNKIFTKQILKIEDVNKKAK